MKLSALVCAHNDEARLADCLRRLDFCDEIVVVADRCTDRSQEIARHHGARLIDGIFPLEGQRKAAGVDACLGEWILEVEPDEQVDAKLAYEVRAAIHGRPAGDWFDVPVDNVLGGTLVRRGWGAGVGEALAPRLYRQRVKRWRPARVDPAVTLEGRHAGALETPIVRRGERDVGQMIARLDRRTSLRAQDLADAGQARGLAADTLRALGRFWIAYVWRQGVREGELGFLIALMAGLDVVLSGVRARNLLKLRAAAAAEPAAEPAQISLAGRR
ncbi:MAG TPA: glycosyltransferase [Phenylobacterium sp.]